MTLKPSEARNAFEIAHAHEIQFRSDGGDETDTRNIITECTECHLLGIHKQTADESKWFVVVVLNEELGADDLNGIEFQPYRRSA